MRRLYGGHGESFNVDSMTTRSVECIEETRGAIWRTEFWCA